MVIPYAAFCPTANTALLDRHTSDMQLDPPDKRSYHRMNVGASALVRFVV